MSHHASHLKILSLLLAAGGIFVGLLQAEENAIPPQAGTQRTIFDNTNPINVTNRPTAPTKFNVAKQLQIAEILTYHWNDHKGKSPGTIGLRHSDGTTYGPWKASGRPGMGGLANAYWVVSPNVVIKPGLYTIVDSDPASWSQNARSGGAGHAIVKAKEATVQLVSVPKLVGLTYAGAKARCQEMGFILSHPPEPYENAAVRTQTPEPESRAPRGSTIKITFDGGVLVPNLVGLTHAAGDARAQELGLTMIHHGESAANAIVRSQAPSPATRVAKGSSVTVAFDALVVVPDLIGLTRVAAEAHARDAGLILVSRGTPSATALIRDQSPDAGQRVARGTKVYVAFESLVVVPDVVGLTLAAAERKIEALGLSLRTTGAAAVSDVIDSQDPLAGTRVPKGSTVEVSFAYVNVPNVVGLTAANAKATLAKVGLEVEWTGVTADPAQLTLYSVKRQDAAAGTRVKKGDRVVCTLEALVSDFGYAGNVLILGNPVTELTATMRFTVTGTKVAGSMNAPPVCEPNKRLYGADIKFTGTVIRPWEKAGTIIWGTYTGDRVPCIGREPRSGPFWIYLAGGKVYLETRNLYYNCYVFTPTGKTFTPVPGPGDPTSQPAFNPTCTGAGGGGATTGEINGRIWLSDRGVRSAGSDVTVVIGTNIGIKASNGTDVVRGTKILAIVQTNAGGFFSANVPAGTALNIIIWKRGYPPQSGSVIGPATYNATLLTESGPGNTGRHLDLDTSQVEKAEPPEEQILFREEFLCVVNPSEGDVFVGNVKLTVPAGWSARADLPEGEGCWFKGEEENPDAAVSVLRENSFDGLVERMTEADRTAFKLAGRDAVRFFGFADKEKKDRQLLIVLDKAEKDGRFLGLLAVSPAAKWENNADAVESILGSITLNGLGGKDPVVPPEEVRLPEDADAVVLTLDYVGGYTRPRRSLEPVLMIRADRRAVATDPFGKLPTVRDTVTAHSFPDFFPFAVTEHRFFSLDSKTLAKEIETALAAKKMGPIADAPTTVIRIRTADRELEVRCYALHQYAELLPELESLQHLSAVEGRLARFVETLRRPAQRP